MVTARALLTGHIDGVTAVDLTPLSTPLSCSWAVDNAVGQIDTITLAAGDTVVAVPQGGPPTGRLLLLLLPPTNAAAVTLKGASGDTGLPLVPNCGHVLGTVGTSVILNAAGPVAGVRLIWL